MPHVLGVPALNDDELAFLAARAAASGITPAMAATAVEEVTGRLPRSVEQFVGGWGAVPFWATAADGTELVVRVGMDERPYTAEAAVLARVRSAGIPAPEVAGVCRVDGRPVSVLVRAPGVPLDQLVGTDGFDDRCTEAGGWLARLHRIDPRDLALSSAPVEGVLALADDLLATMAAEEASLVAAALAQLEPLSPPVPSVLCHLDFGADHVIVDADRITAIIDWEWAGLADPARDVAWWQLFGAEMGGGEAAARAGYGPPDAAFDARVRAWTFGISIAGTHFRRRHQDPAGVAELLDGIRRLLG